MQTGIARFALRFATFIGAAFLALLFSAPAALAGTNDNVDGWIWSGTAGWIAMNCTAFSPSTCGTVDFGTTFADVAGQPGVADLKGWAWSETVGWICFGATCSGTTPEGGAPYAQYRASYHGKTDEIFGWADVTALGADGWISLNCDNDPTIVNCSSSYHLVLNTADGAFTKGSGTDHWGWNGTGAGTGIGWIDFSTAVSSWTTSRIGTVRRPEGIFMPSSTINIKFSGVSAPKNSRIQCDFLESNRTSVTKQSPVFSTAVRNLSTETDPDLLVQFALSGAESYDPATRWTIRTCRVVGPTLATPACGAACTAAGGVCDPDVTLCRLVLSSSAPKEAFTHPTAWTGLGFGQDWYQAIKCYTGFPGSYLGNNEKCDFGGDASFAQTLFHGMPIEGNCSDGIDNNGFGGIDCADPTCKGLSYKCLAHGALDCTYGGVNTYGPSQTVMPDCTSLTAPDGTLCCTTQNKVVTGLECTFGDPNDGYIDCTANPAPPHGDFCCTANNDVIKAP